MEAKEYIKNILNSLDEHHGRLGELKGMFYHLDILFNRHVHDIGEALAAETNLQKKQVLRSYLSISDVTGEESLNGGVEVQNINSNYRVNEENFKQEMELMRFRQAGYTIAQAYESLMTFMKDCAITAYHEDSLLPAYLVTGVPEKRQATLVTRFLNRSAGNAVYITFLSKIYPFFGNSLTVNRRKFHYGKFLMVLEFVRDKFTHSLGNIIKSDKQYSRIMGDQDKRVILLHLFPLAWHDDQAAFQLDFPLAEYVLQLIAEISFQLYKAICMQNNIAWKRHYNPRTQLHEAVL